MRDHLNVKVIRVPVEVTIYNEFKHRCNFYDITFSEFMSLVMKKFVNKEFDYDLGIKKLSISDNIKK